MKLRGVLGRRRERDRIDLPLLSVNLPSGVVPRTEGDGRPAPAEDLSGYQVVRPGDLVMNQLGKPHGALGVSPHLGIISPAYFVASIGPLANPRYVHHLLRSRLYVSEYERRGKFMPPSQFDISWEQFRDIDVLLPPLAEQKAIADYLDTETARIDALIAKKRALTGLAQERLRAYITALTADGPAVRVRRVTSLRTSGPRGWADLVGDSGAPFIRSANLQRQSIELRTDNLAAVDAPRSPEAERSRVRKGDVLIGITGANTGWVGLPGEGEVGGFVSQHVAVLRPSQVDPAWLAYSLFSSRAQDQLLGGQYGGTKQQLGLDGLAELAIALPPPEEQRSRVARLVAVKRRTELVVDSLNHQIALLVEHRQALIAAAVTGDLQIPGLAA